MTSPPASHQRLMPVLLATGAVLLGSCSTAMSDTAAPEQRAVSLRTTACGDASRTRGSGVVVDDGTILTAAHVVVGAEQVFVSGPGAVSSVPDSGVPATEVPADVVLLDVTRDLALLEVSTDDLEPIELGQVEQGAAVRIVGGAGSGTVDAAVDRRVNMDVDDVRSQTRSRRSGYELDVAIAGGDSGAGVYDAEGRLVGIVFATSTERANASFAVGASEIEAVLASTERSAHRCVPPESRLVPTGES